jgi:hypothetical protein
MPKYWMINDRSQGGVGPDVNTAGVTYWVSDKQALTDIKNWRQIPAANFQKLLVAAADKFPARDPAENEKQSHVTILVHGFNNKFTSATRFYQDLCGRLFEGPDSLGLCILYDWPSRGSILGYEPDRSHARLCAQGGVMSEMLCNCTTVRHREHGSPKSATLTRGVRELSLQPKCLPVMFEQG